MVDDTRRKNDDPTRHMQSSTVVASEERNCDFEKISSHTRLCGEIGSLPHLGH